MISKNIHCPKCSSYCAKLSQTKNNSGVNVKFSKTACAAIGVAKGIQIFCSKCGHNFPLGEGIESFLTATGHS